MKLWLVVFAVALLAASFGTAVLARPRMSAGEPRKLSELQSLGDLIAKANTKSIHVIYVHGMRAEKPGEALALIDRLVETFGTKGKVAKTTEPLNLLPWPEHAKVGEIAIWKTKPLWDASQPFVDRYVLTTDNDVTITIDEVNWWPLLFSLKCRTLVAEEARLAGLDRGHLELCRPWISDDAYQEAIKHRPGLRAATKANAYLKHEIMNWGLSDAVIALGPMRTYIRKAIEEAFDFASKDSAATEFVVISESLGSFAVLDAYERKEPGVKRVLDHTYKLYFLANQFALLELARVQNIPDKVWRDGSQLASKAVQPTTVQDTPSPLSALADWTRFSPPKGLRPPPLSTVKQIIAFSDPNDILTFRMPEIGKACIANVYVRIARPVLGLFANPKTAHAGHWDNAGVWKAIVEPTQTEPLSVACQDGAAAKR